MRGCSGAQEGMEGREGAVRVERRVSIEGRNLWFHPAFEHGFTRAGSPVISCQISAIENPVAFRQEKRSQIRDQEEYALDIAAQMY